MTKQERYDNAKRQVIQCEKALDADKWESQAQRNNMYADHGYWQDELYEAAADLKNAEVVVLDRYQENILAFLEKFTIENFRPPTMREIADEFDLSWANLLDMAPKFDTLERNGYIQHNGWDTPILLRNKHGKRVKLAFVEVEE
jgi:hypothetical protein